MVDVFKATQTKSGDIFRLLTFINNNTFYFGIGRNFPWTNDNNPPKPSSLLQSLPNPILYKRCLYAAPVIPSRCNDVNVTKCDNFYYKGEVWEVIDLENTPEKVLEEININFILVEAELTYNEFQQFRSTALFLNLSFEQGVNTNKLLFYPNEVVDTGVMYRVVYHTPIMSVSPKTTRLKMLIKL